MNWNPNFKKRKVKSTKRTPLKITGNSNYALISFLLMTVEKKRNGSKPNVFFL